MTFIPAGARKVDQHYADGGEAYNYAFSPGAGLLRLTQHNAHFGTWWSGNFVDYRGIITVQMEQEYTRLDTVAGGECRVRTWQRAFGDRTVARLCRAFLTDLHGAPGDQP